MSVTIEKVELLTPKEYKIAINTAMGMMTGSNDTVYLQTKLNWENLTTAQRVEFLVESGQPTSLVNEEDITKILSRHALICIAGWQKSINFGDVWNSAGSIGRNAHRMMEIGLCLNAPEKAKDYYGNVIPSRSDVIGGPGSLPFVKAMMGEKYLAWIANIE